MVIKTLSETGTHKPQVTGSSPVAATTTSRKPPQEQGLVYNRQAYSHINPEQGISLNKAIEGFILSCKVEGKSQGTIDCYSDKLKGFLWYVKNFNLPNDISAISHLSTN